MIDHDEILHWLEQNPQQVHGVPSELIARCEQSVRKHATENAWLAAKAYVEGRMHLWELQWGQHATETDVAREVCPLLASELRRHEPHIREGEEPELAGEMVLAALEPEARKRVILWVRELAQQVEHKIWKEIVRFTRKEGRAFVRDHRVSDDESWEGTENYAHKAAHVAELLVRDYEEQLRNQAE